MIAVAKDWAMENMQHMATTKIKDNANSVVALTVRTSENTILAHIFVNIAMQTQVKKSHCKTIEIANKIQMEKQ